VFYDMSTITYYAYTTWTSLSTHRTQHTLTTVLGQGQNTHCHCRVCTITYKQPVNHCRHIGLKQNRAAGIAVRYEFIRSALPVLQAASCRRSSRKIWPGVAQKIERKGLGKPAELFDLTAFKLQTHDTQPI